MKEIRLRVPDSVNLDDILDALDVAIDNQRSDAGELVGHELFGVATRRYRLLSRSLFDQDCLRDIADFCEQQTGEWRAALARRNEQ